MIGLVTEEGGEEEGGEKAIVRSAPDWSDNNSPHLDLLRPPPPPLHHSLHHLPLLQYPPHHLLFWPF